jgi:HEAT repeat protein
MTMNKRTATYVFIVGFAAAAGAGAYRAHADASTSAALHGTATVYKGISADQVEQITPADRIQSIATKVLDTPAPGAIWQALEHGEKVDCLDCIPAVEKLLYVKDAKTREIAAWWLRRRIFGVFGPNEAYQRTIQTLQTHTDATTRAQAAEALGEFLSVGGVAPVATALVSDGAPEVRAAAARALDRMNSTGPNHELSQAMSDTDATVRLTAVRAAMHIHGFTDVAAVAGLVSDTSAEVRRQAVSALGSMRARDSVAALVALTSPATETDAITRAEAAHALGIIALKATPALDGSTVDLVKRTLDDAKADPDTNVQDAAAIARRPLG